MTVILQEQGIEISGNKLLETGFQLGNVCLLELLVLEKCLCLYGTTASKTKSIFRCICKIVNVCCFHHACLSSVCLPAAA